MFINTKDTFAISALLMESAIIFKKFMIISSTTLAIKSNSFR